MIRKRNTPSQDHGNAGFAPGPGSRLKTFHTGLVGEAIVFSEKREETVGERPGFDVGVIDENDEGAEDADDAEIFDKAVFAPDAVEDARRGAVAEPAAVTAQRPFDPH